MEYWMAATNPDGTFAIGKGDNELLFTRNRDLAILVKDLLNGQVPMNERALAEASEALFRWRTDGSDNGMWGRASSDHRAKLTITTYLKALAA